MLLNAEGDSAVFLFNYLQDYLTTSLNSVNPLKGKEPGATTQFTNVPVTEMALFNFS
jgi:hypothetical protein